MVAPVERQYCPHQHGQEQPPLSASSGVQQHAFFAACILFFAFLQEGRKPHAHSNYVRVPIFLHGLEGQLDCMIEAKCKASSWVGAGLC